MRGGFRGSDTRSNYIRPNGGDRGGFNNRRGGFNDRRGELYNRQDGYYDRRDGDYDVRGGYNGGFDARQQAGRGRGNKKASKPWRQGEIKRFGDDRPFDVDQPPVAAAADTQQPTDAPASERHRPPDTAGQRTIQAALALANAIRVKSGSWRLGAARELKTDKAPRGQSLVEAVRIAEAEAALFKEARETQAVLSEYRDEMHTGAPPAAIVNNPTPPLEIDVAAIAMITNQIVAQLKQ